MNKLIISIIFSLLIHTINAQSPWIQSEHFFYSQISINIIPQYNLIYMRDGSERQLGRDYTDVTMQGWFEYGFSENTTVILSLPFKYLKAGEVVAESASQSPTESGTLTAPGTIEIGFRQAVLTRNVRLSGQILFELKTGVYDRRTGLRSGYDSWGIVPLISIGYGEEKFYGFLYLGSGFRSNNYSSFLRSGCEGGYKITGSSWIVGFIDINRSYRDGSYTPSVNNFNTAFYIDEQEYIAWGLKTIIPLSQNKYGFVATFAGAFSGNNVAKSPSINLGFFYKFKIF